jgi:TRAP-type C4-dicarboxylate transport system permease small subunit
MAVLPPVSARVKRLSDRVNRGVELLLFLIGSSMALVTGIQVFSRYLLNHSLFWSEEVGRICLVWLSFLGASAAYKRGAHIGIGILVERLPVRPRRVIGLLVILLALLFFSILIIHGSSFVVFAAKQKTAALGIPKSIPYLVLPLSGTVLFLHGLDHLLELLTKQS